MGTTKIKPIRHSLQIEVQSHTMSAYTQHLFDSLENFNVRHVILSVKTRKKIEYIKSVFWLDKIVELFEDWLCVCVCARSIYDVLVLLIGNLFL